MSAKRWLQELDHNMLLCRDLGHQWRYLTAARTSTGYVRRLRCTNCGTEKEQKLDRKADLVSTRYSHTTGYLAPRGTSAPSRSEVRRLSVTRRMSEKKE